MRHKLSKELKEAIEHLPETEKEKLLFKLLPHHPDVCRKLEFELLEDREKLQARRGHITNLINQVVTGHYFTAGWLMMEMKKAIAEIEAHTKITNDKEGEILLLLQLLTRTFQEQSTYLKKATNRSGNLPEFLVVKTFELLQKAGKLHPELVIDFELEINNLLLQVHNSAAASVAREKDLPEQLP